MEKLPSMLKPKNKDNFPKFWEKNRISLLRQHIYEHVLCNDENSYFEIDAWAKKYYDNNLPKTQEIVEKYMIPELQYLGWKCKTSYGNTALFIYSTAGPPSSCYEDGF